MQPLQDGLRDKSAYVRKTAVLGSVKLFYVNETVLHGLCRRHCLSVSYTDCIRV
jgi:vesicle coat complex subunit